MMQLERLLKRGSLKHEGKTFLGRLKHGVEGVRPHIGGVEIVDLAFSFPIALTYCVCFLSIFVYFAYTTFDNSVKTKVLSASHITAGMECEPISKNLDGTYTADLNGYWERENNYTEDLSGFILETYGKALTEDEYTTAMQYFKNEASSFASFAANRTTAWNLAVLAAAGYMHPDTGLGFSFTADATFMYDILTKVATISNQNGVCTGLNADPSRGLKAEYLSGSFKEELASLTLNMPFRVNASSINGGFAIGKNRVKDASKFSITFTPTIQEPCPLHGNWFTNVFYGAEAEYRNGFAEIGFDVRSAMVAIAMNIGRVGTDSLVWKRTSVTDALGMIGLVDPFYEFPRFQRIYCVNKSAPLWSDYNFSPDEKKEQKRQFNRTYRITDPTFRPEKYPNICFLTPKTKSGLIKFYYPMVSMLKSDRDPCWSLRPPPGMTTACKAGTKRKNSPIMVGCKCPRDKADIDCSRRSLFTSFFYDTDIAHSQRGSNGKWEDAPKRTSLDNVIKLGIAVQKKMIEWKNGNVGNEYDVKAMELFDDVVATTISEYNNMAAANITFSTVQPDFPNAKTPRNGLRAAWQTLLRLVPNLTPGTLAPVSAIVFRSQGMYGYGNIILPINQYNLQMDELTSRDPRSTNYFEVGVGLMLPATACANPFNYASAFERMITTPPAPLTETYYSCMRKPQFSWIVAMGSAYSSANVVLNLLWAAAGTLLVWGWKRYLRHKNSPETVVSHRAKRRLEGFLQELKDESLVGVVNDLLARIAALEKQVSIHSSMHDDKSTEDNEWCRQVFSRLYNPKSSVEDDTIVAQQLGEREREDTLRQMDQFKRKLSMVASVSRYGTRAEAETVTEAGAEAQSEAVMEAQAQAEADGEVEMRSFLSVKRSQPNHFSPAQRPHQQQQQQQQQHYEDQVASEWEGDAEPIEHFTHNPQHQLQHKHKQQPHGLDEEVAAAARRMSQRILSPSGPVPDMGVAAIAARKARAALSSAESGPSPPPKRLSTLPLSSGLPPSLNRIHK